MILRGSRTFLCFLLLASSGSSALAARYYVDQTHGSDRADGQSARTAWQHLSAVYRYARDRRFRPGDSVLLKAGERWREQLEIVDNHGKPDAAIRISSYGTGAYPTIDGADSLTHWTRVSGAVYQAPATDVVYKVFVDGDDRPTQALVPVVNFVGDWQAGQDYQMWDSVQNQGRGFIAMGSPSDRRRIGPADWYRVGAPDGTQKDGLSNVTQTAGSWWYDAKGKRVLVHLRDGSSPESHQIQVTTRRYGVRLQSSSNVAINGLRIIHAAKSGIIATVGDAPSAGAAEDNQFNSIENCIFWNVADTTSDFLPALNMGGEGAIFVAAGIGPNRQPLAGWKIRDNAIGIIDSSRNLAYDRDGILVTGTSGLTLQNNYVATANALGISVVSDHGPACTSPSISANYLTNNDGNLRVSGCNQPSIDGNTIAYTYGYGIQIGGNSSEAKILRNHIHHIERLGQENAYNGVDCNGGAPGGTMSQNSIAAVWGAEATFEVGCGHWTVENNLFDSSANAKGGGLTLYIRRESLPGLQFRNNTYRLNASTNRQFNHGAGEPGAQTFHDFSWWQKNIEASATTSVKPDAAMLLPAGSFTKTPAATSYLSTAPEIRWEP